MEELVPRYLYNSENRSIGWANLFPGIVPHLPGANQHKVLDDKVKKSALFHWGLLSPEQLSALAADDPAWSNWNRYVGTSDEKLKTLRDRIKVLKVVWGEYPKALGKTSCLLPLSIRFLESISQALSQCEDGSMALKRKLLVEDARMLAALAMRRFLELARLQKGGAIDKGGLDFLGTVFESIPFEADFRELFHHALDCLHNGQEVDPQWSRCLARELDLVEVISTNSELERCAEASAKQAYRSLNKTQSVVQNPFFHIENPSWAQVEDSKECSFGPLKGAILRRQGGRKSQEDGGWVGLINTKKRKQKISVPSFFLGDGNAGRGAINFFMDSVQGSLSKDLAEMERWSKPEVYNTVMRTLHGLRISWALNFPEDPSGFVGVLGLLIDEQLHLFSWGNLTGVLAGPGNLCNLLPWDVFDHQEMNDIDSLSAQLWRKMTGAGAHLSYLFGKGKGQVLAATTQGVVGLNTMNTFGANCGVSGVFFQPHYTYLPSTMFKQNKLCFVTDGVGAKISPHEIGQYLATSRKHARYEGRDLIDRAYQRAGYNKKNGSPDNATVMILHHSEKKSS